MSKNTEMLHELGEFSVNQLLALGVKLGGPQVVDQILAASQLTCQLGGQDQPGVLTDDVDAAVVSNLKELFVQHHGEVNKDYPLLAQPGGLTFLESAVQKAVAFAASQRNAYVVPVDYDLAHVEQIKVGNYDWITEYDNNLIQLDPSVTYKKDAKPRAEHLFSFPKGQHDVRITLVDPEGELTDNQVLAKMEDLNLRPTVSAETLALGATFPDLQRENPLVGLGSAWVASDGDRDCLYLGRDSGGRYLDLGWGGCPFSARCRFPAVCKDPSST